MRKSSVARVLLWSVLGTAFGFCYLSRADVLERYPLINTIVLVPVSLLAEAMFSLGLAPAGDARFVIILMAMILQWTILGFLAGLYRGWWLGRKSPAGLQASDVGHAPDQATHPSRRPLKFVGRHIHLSAGVVVLALVVCYCLWQEILLSRDRDFFLRHIDRAAVAQACLEILSKPERDRRDVGLYLGRDPRLPEAIRRLEPKAVSIHIDEIAITKTSHPFYNCLTFTQDKANPARYDLWYYEGSSHARTTHVYSIDRKP